MWKIQRPRLANKIEEQSWRTDTAQLQDYKAAIIKTGIDKRTDKYINGPE